MLEIPRIAIPQTWKEMNIEKNYIRNYFKAWFLSLKIHSLRMSCLLYAVDMLNLDLRHVSCCLKICNNLKVIVRYESFVKQLWWILRQNFDRKTNLSHKIALWNWPQARSKSWHFL
jgi:hypothetical protein